MRNEWPNRGLWIGTNIGGKTGLILATLYVSPILLPVLIGAILAVWSGLPFWESSFLLTLTFLSAAVPGTLLGLLLGAALGFFWERRKSPSSEETVALVGAGFATMVAVPVNVVLLSLAVSDPATFGLVFWCCGAGFPSLVFIAAGGWISMRVLRQLSAPTRALKLPFHLPNWLQSDALMIGMGAVIVLASVTFVMGSYSLATGPGFVVLPTLAVVMGLVVILFYGMRRRALRLLRPESIISS